MSQATMTSKGQITVPKDVRDELGLEPGTKVTFVRVGPREYRIRAKSRSLLELGGIARYSGPPMSVEEMDDAIAVGMAESAE